MTIDYNQFGRLLAITDTMNRVINFEYDSNQRLQAIKQTRSTGVHTWATFGYTTLVVATNFRDEANKPMVVQGLPADNTISVLSQIGLENGSRYNFEYTSWGQVHRIRHLAADGHLLNQRSYDLPLTNSAPQTDCPRFTQRQDVVENWNNGNAVTTSFQFGPGGAWGQVTAPDGTVFKEFFNFANWGWGLTTRTEVYSADNLTTPKKTTVITWTQDNTTVSYPINPRPISMQTSDPDGNRRQTTIEYTSFGLPFDVFEWGPHGSTGWTLLRRTHTDYDLSAVYTDRRIFGLVKGQYLFGPSSAPPTTNAQMLFSKATFEYDAGGEFLQHQGAPVQFDAANFGAGLVQGRGNLTSARRWDVNNETNISQSVASSMAYNTQGSVIFSRDPLGHQTTIGYADAFSTNGTDTTTLSFSTLAYPTMVTVADPDNFSSTAKYNYDLGMATRAQDPKGAAQTREYDSAGRVTRVTNAVNNAFTRWVYPASQTIVNKFTTVNDLVSEAYSATVFDGAGRVRATASDFPATTPHYSGQYTFYDVMGRAVSQTNPIEMTGVWTATDADATAQGGFGWIFTTQTYDWKGRPMVTTNTDLTTKEASYGGCGCAGGEVVTLTDEGTVVSSGGTSVAKKRQQKIYSDALGRTVKAEVLNWDGAGAFGTGGSVYSSTVTTYNARDQVTLVRQFQGTAPVDPNDLSCPSGTCQQTTMSYDGHGRLKTRHVPEQNAGTNTVWDYNSDDTIQRVTDARSASQTFSYNNRHLTTAISYTAPAGITIPAAVSFAYDAAGNRTQMSDGLGSMSYQYDTLSRLTSETRTYSDPNNTAINGVSKTLSYDYNLAGELKKITDSTNVTINYVYDLAGRVSNVTGSDTLYAGVSQYASGFGYRAWGGLKQMTDGSNRTSSLLYNARLRATQFQISGGVVTQNYDYYNDGRIKFIQNSTDANFDRAYLYDHVGRLTEGQSGALARGQLPGLIPYYETFFYDAWSHLTGRNTDSWSIDSFSDFGSYANNRRAGWGYDADGRNTTIDTRTYSYDAAGRQWLMTGQRWVINHYIPTSQSSGYDGDGRRVKEEFGGITTYYLSSTVMGGAIIEEINGSGQKQAGYVYYPGGKQLATQTLNEVVWTHSTPANTTKYEIRSSGGSISRLEFDPVGADVPLGAPSNPDPGSQDGDINGRNIEALMNSRYAALNNPASGCVVDGFETSCANAMSFSNFGTGNSTAFVDNGSVTMHEIAHSVLLSASPQAIFAPAGNSIAGINPGDAGSGESILLEEVLGIPGPADATTYIPGTAAVTVAPPATVASLTTSGGVISAAITLRALLPQNPGQQKKEPCPPVSETPPGVSLDDNIRRARHHRPSGAFFAYDDAKWFKSMVTHKAPWDYKRIHIKYEDFGNFNLGATGAAIGFSLVTLLSEAGKLQAVPPGMTEKPKEWGYPAGRLWGKGQYPYGDEPKDAKQIEAGMNYYVRKFVKKDCE